MSPLSFLSTTAATLSATASRLATAAASVAQPGAEPGATGAVFLLPVALENAAEPAVGAPVRRRTGGTGQEDAAPGKDLPDGQDAADGGTAPPVWLPAAAVLPDPRVPVSGPDAASAGPDAVGDRDGAERPAPLPDAVALGWSLRGPAEPATVAPDGQNNVPTAPAIAPTPHTSVPTPDAGRQATMRARPVAPASAIQSPASALPVESPVLNRASGSLQTARQIRAERVHAVGDASPAMPATALSTTAVGAAGVAAASPIPSPAPVRPATADGEVVARVPVRPAAADGGASARVPVRPAAADDGAVAGVSIAASAAVEPPRFDRAVSSPGSSSAVRPGEAAPTVDPTLIVPGKPTAREVGVSTAPRPGTAAMPRTLAALARPEAQVATARASTEQLVAAGSRPARFTAPVPVVPADLPGAAALPGARASVSDAVAPPMTDAPGSPIAEARSVSVQTTRTLAQHSAGVPVAKGAASAPVGADDRVSAVTLPMTAAGPRVPAALTGAIEGVPVSADRSVVAGAPSISGAPEVVAAGDRVAAITDPPAPILSPAAPVAQPLAADRATQVDAAPQLPAQPAVPLERGMTTIQQSSRRTAPADQVAALAPIAATRSVAVPDAMARVGAVPAALPPIMTRPVADRPVAATAGPLFAVAAAAAGFVRPTPNSGTSPTQPDTAPPPVGGGRDPAGSDSAAARDAVSAPVTMPLPAPAAIFQPRVGLSLHAGAWRDEAAALAVPDAPGTTPLTAGLAPPTGTVPTVLAPQGAPLDMGDRGWPQAMVDRIEALRDAADAVDTSIRVVPDALGAIDVSVRRENDSIHVHLSAEQAQTRALLQDAQPRLAELAEARGLKLGQTSVGTSGNPGGNASGGGAFDGREGQRQPARPAPSAASAAPAPAATDDHRIA